jgi:hypothetical protein
MHDLQNKYAWYGGAAYIPVMRLASKKNRSRAKGRQMA